MKKTITITIDEKTADAIKKKAIAEKRSFSSQIDWILTDYVYKNLKRKVNRPTKAEYEARQSQEYEEEPEEEASTEQVEAGLYTLYLNNGSHNMTPKQWWEERKKTHPEIEKSSFQKFTEEIRESMKK